MSGKDIEMNNDLKEENKTKEINNKKFIIALAVVIIVAILLGVGIVYAITGKSEGKTGNKTGIGKIKDKFRDVVITANEIKDIQIETYSNADFSMDIPEGWKIEIGTTGYDRYSYYAFTVYNPENPSYRMFFNMKTDGYLKSENDKKLFSWYKNSPFYILPVLDPLTVDNFYNNYTNGMKYFYSDSMSIPTIKEFSTIEKLGNAAIGGDIVRATYKDENNKTIDGIFTTTLVPTSLGYATAIGAYNTVFYTAEEGKLVEWQGTLNKCLASVTFTDEFTSAYYNAQDNMMKTARANQKMYDEISNTITEGWNARQNTYDIISQKQSDATLGYERVYDTTTGEIYKAENGFMDHDWNGRYESVTDNMYNLPTAGYIEKK